jgi:hypothetical protein
MHEIKTELLNEISRHFFDKIREGAATPFRLESGRGTTLIPEYMVDGLLTYVIYGQEPGRFLSAVLSNDFMAAARAADDSNAASLMGWSRMLYNYVPANCFGSRFHFESWIKSGGTQGTAGGNPVED